MSTIQENKPNTYDSYISSKIIIPTEKYAIGDIFHHHMDSSYKIKIIWIFSVFYDETGYNKDIYYQTRQIHNTEYPPSPMSQSALDKYYIKISNTK
jgi:hypothetical protein